MCRVITTMLQDYLRSAIFRSLTDPPTKSCCENGSRSASCKTRANSKTKNTDHHQPKNHHHAALAGKAGPQDLEDRRKKRGEYCRDKSHHAQLCRDLTHGVGSFSESTPNHPAIDLEDSLAMLSMRHCSQGRRKRGMSHLKYKQTPRFAEEGFGDSERRGCRRYGVEDRRHSVDGSCLCSAEQIQRMNLLKLKQRSESVMVDENGVGERRYSSGRGLQMFPRYSFDGSSRPEEPNWMPHLKFRQSSGVDETRGSKGFERHEPPRVSVGGASLDTIEELRRVIKGSLCRQNLLSRSPEDDKTCITQSSSSCPGGRSERFKGAGRGTEAKLPTSDSATPLTKMEKGPNLIAKLMGLEESPLQTAESVNKEHKSKTKSAVPRPVFDAERPTAKKLQLLGKKKADDPKQKSLQEIIESMHFNGLLKSSHVDVPMIKQRLHDEKQSEKDRRNFNPLGESPPIVVMKPLYSPQWERPKNLILDNFSRIKEMEHAYLISEDEDEVSDHGKMLCKTFDQKEVKRNDKAKADSSSVHHTERRKVELKTRKKPRREGNKLLQDGTLVEEEKRPVKAKRMQTSQCNTTKTAPAQPDRRHSTTKKQVFPVKPASNSKNYSLKEKIIPRAKSSRKSTDAQINDKNCEHVKGATSVNETDILSGSERLPAKRTPQERGKDGKKCQKDGTGESSQEGSMPKTSQAVKATEPAQEVISLSGTTPATGGVGVVEDDLVHLLLRSRSFLARAQGLCSIDARHQPIHHQRKGIDEDVMRNAKLYLDCGKELVARKSHRHELIIYPVLRTQTASFTSLHQLAEEMSSRIRMLTGYNKVDTNINTPDETLYARLGRDLRCRDIPVNAMWDIGWLTCGYPEEAVQLACEVGESIISSLIADVAMEFVYYY